MWGTDLGNTVFERKTMPFVRKRRHLSSSSGASQVEAEGLAWLCFAEDHSWFQGTISTDDESNYSLYGRRDSVAGAVVDVEGRRGEGINKDILEKLGQVLGGAEGEHPRKTSCAESESTESSEEDSYADGMEAGGCSDVSSNESGVKEDLMMYSTDEEESKPCHEYYFRYSVILTDHFSGLSYQLPKIYVRLNMNGEHSYAGQNIFSSNDAQISFEVNNVFKGQKADMVIQRHIGAPTLLGQKCMVYTGPMSIAFNHVLENGQSWCL